MSTVIAHNLMAVNTHRQLSLNGTAQSKTTEKLASGYKINRAADDAAGLSISEKMRAQIRGLNQASTNAQDGISLIQAAEGALQETHSILQRMRELSVKAATETNATVDRDYIQQEIDAMTAEIDRIASTTTFNEKEILATDQKMKIHVGANANQVITVTITAMSAQSLGISGIKVTGLTMTAGTISSNAAISAIDAAIQKVSRLRSALGAVQNRLEHTVKNLDTVSENIQAAESRIRDADMAKEMMDYTKNNILSQAATAMLAQANQAPQNVLSLIK